MILRTFGFLIGIIMPLTSCIQNSTRLGAVKSSEDSLWAYDGSIVRLVSNGKERTIMVEQPSDSLISAGAKKGYILFSGERESNHYTGVAKFFSQQCDLPIEYSVQGYAKTEDIISLSATVVPYSTNCKLPTDELLKPLLFKFSSLGAPDISTEGEILDHACGDNCYLTIRDDNGIKHEALCHASPCENWNWSDLPQNIIGRRVRVTIGKDAQLDGEGQIVSLLDSLVKIQLLN